MQVAVVGDGGRCGADRGGLGGQADGGVCGCEGGVIVSQAAVVAAAQGQARHRTQGDILIVDHMFAAQVAHIARARHSERLIVHARGCQELPRKAGAAVVHPGARQDQVRLVNLQSTVDRGDRVVGLGTGRHGVDKTACIFAHGTCRRNADQVGHNIAALQTADREPAHGLIKTVVSDCAAVARGGQCRLVNHQIGIGLTDAVIGQIRTGHHQAGAVGPSISSAGRAGYRNVVTLHETGGRQQLALNRTVVGHLGRCGADRCRFGGDADAGMAGAQIVVVGTQSGVGACAAAHGQAGHAVERLVRLHMLAAEIGRVASSGHRESLIVHACGCQV